MNIESSMPSMIPISQRPTDVQESPVVLTHSSIDSTTSSNGEEDSSASSNDSIDVDEQEENENDEDNFVDENMFQNLMVSPVNKAINDTFLTHFDKEDVFQHELLQDGHNRNMDLDFLNISFEWTPEDLTNGEEQQMSQVILNFFNILFGSHSTMSFPKFTGRGDGKKEKSSIHCKNSTLPERVQKKECKVTLHPCEIYILRENKSDLVEHIKKHHGIFLKTSTDSRFCFNPQQSGPSLSMSQLVESIIATCNGWMHFSLAGMRWKISGELDHPDLGDQFFSELKKVQEFSTTNPVVLKVNIHRVDIACQFLAKTGILPLFHADRGTPMSKKNCHRSFIYPIHQLKPTISVLHGFFKPCLQKGSWTNVAIIPDEVDEDIEEMNEDVNFPAAFYEVNNNHNDVDRLAYTMENQDEQDHIRVNYTDEKDIWKIKAYSTIAHIFRSYNLKEICVLNYCNQYEQQRPSNITYQQNNSRLQKLLSYWKSACDAITKIGLHYRFEVSIIPDSGIFSPDCLYNFGSVEDMLNLYSKGIKNAFELGLRVTRKNNLPKLQMLNDEIRHVSGTIYQALRHRSSLSPKQTVSPEKCLWLNFMYDRLCVLAGATGNKAMFHVKKWFNTPENLRHDPHGYAKLLYLQKEEINLRYINCDTGYMTEAGWKKVSSMFNEKLTSFLDSDYFQQNHNNIYQDEAIWTMRNRVLNSFKNKFLQKYEQGTYLLTSALWVELVNNIVNDSDLLSSPESVATLNKVKEIFDDVERRVVHPYNHVPAEFVPTNDDLLVMSSQQAIPFENVEEELIAQQNHPMLNQDGIVIPIILFDASLEKKLFLDILLSIGPKLNSWWEYLSLSIVDKLTTIGEQNVNDPIHLEPSYKNDAGIRNEMIEIIQDDNVTWFRNTTRMRKIKKLCGHPNKSTDSSLSKTVIGMAAVISNEFGFYNNLEDYLGNESIINREIQRRLVSERLIRDAGGHVQEINNYV